MALFQPGRRRPSALPPRPDSMSATIRAGGDGSGTADAQRLVVSMQQAAAGEKAHPAPPCRD